jgi:hypothetical protein
MKNLLFSLLLSVTTLISFSQTQKYFYPNYAEMFILDSLGIPYLPIPERTGISPVGVTYSTQKGVELHRKFFRNNEFDFYMSGDRSPINLMNFLDSYDFYTESDRFLVSLYSSTETDVVGYAKIDLKGGKYKKLIIFEYHWIANDTYGTIILLENHSGLMTFIDTDRHPVDYSWQPSFQ